MTKFFKLLARLTTKRLTLDELSILATLQYKLSKLQKLQPKNVEEIKSIEDAIRKLRFPTLKERVIFRLNAEKAKVLYLESAKDVRSMDKWVQFVKQAEKKFAKRYELIGYGADTYIVSEDLLQELVNLVVGKDGVSWSKEELKVRRPVDYYNLYPEELNK